MIHTGEFKKFSKDLDLMPKSAAAKKGEEAAPLDDFSAEKELIANQIYWIGVM